MIGQTISHYRIVAKLGEGGMGVVYKAEDLKLGRAVALKFLPPHLLESEEHKARFLHEARAAALLDDPNICTVYEIDEAGGQTFLAMAFLEGQTLRQKIVARPLPLAEAIEIATQIGHGMQAAHEKGVVHRDIKPANIMITPQGQVKIMDFGLAQLSNRTRLTATGTKLGTPAYMSPEQTEGKPADRRTDIWALGVVLYEMISGRVPFAGEADAAVAYAILHTEAEPLTALRSGMPLQIDAIAAKALAKSPAERYQHIEDLLVDLRACAKQSARSSAPAGASASHASPASKHASALGTYSEEAGKRQGARLLPVAYVLLGALIAIGGLWLGPGIRQRLFPAGPSLGENARLLQLTTYSGTEASGAISPDGRSFAFVSERGGQPDIWVRQVAGGEPVQLTADAAAEDNPVYSPDGESLYYTSGGSIWRIGALGGAPRKIVDSAAQPAPSPDGRRLAYGRGFGTSGGSVSIEVANTDGTSASKIFESPGFLSLCWSPDGRRLAFWQTGLFQINQAFVVDIDGSNERQVTRFEFGSVYGVTWLPDSQHLVISRANDLTPIPQATDLWLAPIGGGPVRRLTAGVTGRLFRPSVSADGRRILATLQYAEREVWIAPLDGDPVANGNAARRLLDPSTDPMWIQLPHGGDSLLVNSNATGTRNLWLLPLDHAAPMRQITMFGDNSVGHASLSPDGSKVAYSSLETGNAEIWTANVDGSAPRQITDDPAADFWPIWSPDGKWIVFGSLRGHGAQQLWKISSEGGEAVLLTPETGTRGDWSPSGNRLVYYGERRINLLDMDSGKIVRTFPQLDYENALPVFSPDGRQFSAPQRDGSVWIFDTESGEGRIAVQFPAPFPMVFRACWTRDGKSLIVNRNLTRSHIALLEIY
jgi:Tol biopolymer transport system component